MALSTKRILGIKWKGLGQIPANIDKVVATVEGDSLKALIMEARKIKRDAESLTPIDTKNLRNSSYLLWGGEKKKGVSGGDTAAKFKGLQRRWGRLYKVGRVIGERNADHSRTIKTMKSQNANRKTPFAVIGFSASYAIYVHETLGNYHKVGQAKFLETAIKRNKKGMFSRIKSFIRNGLRGKR